MKGIFYAFSALLCAVGDSSLSLRMTDLCKVYGDTVRTDISKKI